MHNLRRRLLLDALRAADVAAMAAAFGGALYASAEHALAGDVSRFLLYRVKLQNALLVVLFAFAWHLIMSSRGLYRSHRIGLIVSEWWEVTKAVTLGVLLLAGLALVFELQAVDRTFLVTFYAIALLGMLGMRTGLRILLGEVRRKGRNLRHLIIVGCGPRGTLFGEQVRHRAELGYNLLGYMDDAPAPLNPITGEPETMLGSLQDVEEVFRRHPVDEVVIALPLKSQYAAIARIIAIAEDLGLTVRIPAGLFQLRLAKASVDFLEDIPIVSFHAPVPPYEGLVIKRLLDVVVSAALLLVLLPLMAALALLIRLDSRGPALFRQERVGQGRNRFRMLKFRTMVHDAEARLPTLEAQNEVAGAAFKMRRDPRVTRVGRFLRRFSLDELPSSGTCSGVT